MAFAADQSQTTTQYSPRTGSIIRFVWHHQAGTDDDATIAMMVNRTKELSATWTVDNKPPVGAALRDYARITQVVPDQFRPWTSSSALVDGQALTVEVCNSTGAPDYGIADSSFEACARLAAYAYQAYGVPLRRITSAADGSGHIGHREIPAIWPGEGYATACPMNLDIDRILARAAQLVGGFIGSAALTPTPAPEEIDMPLDQNDKDWFANQLAGVAENAAEARRLAGIAVDQTTDQAKNASVAYVLRSEGVSGAGDVNALAAAFVAKLPPSSGGSLSVDVAKAALLAAFAEIGAAA